MPGSGKAGGYRDSPSGSFCTSSTDKKKRRRDPVMVCLDGIDGKSADGVNSPLKAQLKILKDELREVKRKASLNEKKISRMSNSNEETSASTVIAKLQEEFKNKDKMIKVLNIEIREGQKQIAATDRTYRRTYSELIQERDRVNYLQDELANRDGKLRRCRHRLDDVEHKLSSMKYQTSQENPDS